MRAVNLLPRDTPRSRRQAPALVTQLLVAVPLLVAVLLGTVWFFAGSGLPEKRQTLTDLKAELAAIPTPTATVQQDPTVSAQHEERVSALAGALDSRISWDRILRHVSAVLPRDVWLTKLAASSQPVTSAPTTTATTATTGTTETQPSTTTTATPPPVETTASQIEIDGYTYSQDAVARFMSRLAVVPDLANVQLISSTRAVIAKHAVVQFTITAGIRGNGSSA